MKHKNKKIKKDKNMKGNIMEEMITLCGDNCFACPRYLAKSEEELEKTAELWHRVGWRDRIVSAEEIRCTGCSSHKACTYHLVECIKKHGITKCNQCSCYPCEKINKMLERSKEYQKVCKVKCSKKEYQMLEEAFFRKESNLEKQCTQKET